MMRSWVLDNTRLVVWSCDWRSPTRVRPSIVRMRVVWLVKSRRDMVCRARNAVQGSVRPRVVGGRMGAARVGK